MKPLLIVALILGMSAGSSNAQERGRKPCSGGAGGISHCLNGKFVCKNGNISNSARICLPDQSIGEVRSSSPKTEQRPRQALRTPFWKRNRYAIN